MQPMMIAVAINPKAAAGAHQQAGEETAAVFRSAGSTVDVLREGSFEGLLGACAEAVKRGIDALVVVGGDGMVHLGLNALAEAGATSTVPLGIIPTGTGNDFARALGLPMKNVRAACERALAALEGGGRLVDAGRVTAGGTSTWFAGVVSAGFDAVVNERANSWHWPHGNSRYKLAMLREILTFKAIDYEVTADGETWQQGAMLISVANAQSIGGGMKLVPDARLDDGLLDLFIVRPLRRTAFLAVFPRVFSGGHVNHPAVEIRRVRRVQLSARDVVAYGDGERIGPLPITVEVMPAALRVLA
jgi:diacylglycerol kinase (ATP)